jgi:hypothetical protein
VDQRQTQAEFVNDEQQRLLEIEDMRPPCRPALADGRQWEHPGGAGDYRRFRHLQLAPAQGLEALPARTGTARRADLRRGKFPALRLWRSCFPRQDTPPGHQSLLVHLKNSGFVILSGDVVHSGENYEKNIVPSQNTNKQDSLASMLKIRQLIATYKATLFINHDKRQEDKLRLLPAFYD